MKSTREDIINHLTNEWRLLCLEEYDEDDESPEEYREYLETLTYDELRNEV